MENKFVLIVDDDAGHRDVIREAIETLVGARTGQTGSGSEALVLAQQQRPDLILLDAYLPDLNGCEVARRLKADPATAMIPIVAVSAHCVDIGCPPDMASCDGCVPKPFDLDRLLDTVCRFLAATGR